MRNNPKEKLLGEMADRASQKASTTAALENIDRRNREKLAREASEKSADATKGSGNIRPLLGPSLLNEPESGQEFPAPETPQKRSWWRSLLSARSTPQESAAAQPMNEAGPAAEESAPRLKENWPIKDLDPALRALMRFKLTNSEHGRVVMVIALTEGATEEQFALVKIALESKTWGTKAEQEEKSEGYKPKIISNGNKSILALADANKIASLISELQAAGVPVGKSPAFTSTPEFDAALSLRDIKFRGQGGPARS